MFLGSLALAAPAMAGVRVAQAPSAPAADRASTDVVFDQIRRQLVAARQQAHAHGGMTAEDAAASAAVLRVAAAHTRALGLDRTAVAALQGVIDHRGRDAIAPQPTAAWFDRLAQRGIEVPPRLRDVPDEANTRSRADALDTILEGQASTAFDRLAVSFDRTVPRLARRSVGPAVLRVGQDTSLCTLLLADFQTCWYYAMFFTVLAEASADFWPLALNFWEALLVFNGMIQDICR